VQVTNPRRFLSVIVATVVVIVISVVILTTGHHKARHPGQIRSGQILATILTHPTGGPPAVLAARRQMIAVTVSVVTINRPQPQMVQILDLPHRYAAVFAGHPQQLEFIASAGQTLSVNSISHCYAPVASQSLQTFVDYWQTFLPQARPGLHYHVVQSSSRTVISWIAREPSSGAGPAPTTSGQVTIDASGRIARAQIRENHLLTTAAVFRYPSTIKHHVLPQRLCH
jgi:hypothetical protein